MDANETTGLTGNLAVSGLDAALLRCQGDPARPIPTASHTDVYRALLTVTHYLAQRAREILTPWQPSNP